MPSPIEESDPKPPLLTGNLAQPEIDTPIPDEPIEFSDARLVEEVRGGNTEAFAGLVNRYERKLLRVIGRMISDPELVRDLAQETFLRVFQNLHQFDTSRRFGPWLFRVGVNLCVDHLRHRELSQTRFSEAPNGDDGWAFDVADADPRVYRELHQEVHHVLNQIPLKYRTILVLRDLEGFSCSEVAAIANRREATIRWRLAKARTMFRKLWEQRERDERHVWPVEKSRPSTGGTPR